jgi:hypothetical protein
MGLPLESRTRRLALAHLGAKHLDGNESPQRRLSGEEDQGGAPLSEWPLDGEFRSQ